MRRALTIALGTALLFATAAPAQDADAYEQYRTFARNALDQRILPAFRRALGAEHRAVLQRIEIAFPSDLRIDHVIAHEVHGTPRIDISTGSLVHIHRFVEAGFHVFEFGGEERRLRYLLRTAREMRQASRPGGVPGRAMSYLEYVGMDDDEARRWQQERHFQINETMVQALAFLFAHELGHHVLGHRPFPRIETAEQGRRSRDQEYAADGYALALMARAGFNPVTALPYVEFAAALEGFNTDEGDLAGHPPALCRYMRYLGAGVQTMLEDRDFQQAVRDEPGLGQKYREMARLAARAQRENNCER